MKAFAFKIFRLLGSRTALNIYFWLLAIDLMISNLQGRMYYPAKWHVLFVAINLSLLMLLVYVNNFVLVPKLLARKKRSWYFMSVFAYTVLLASIYTAVQKYIVIHFPRIDISQISFISAPISHNWSLHNFVDEFQTFFAAFVMLVFVFTALWYMHDYARQQKVSQEAAKKQTETELSFLKSQLNPHFLFNTLNNLYGLALTKSDDAPAAILKLSALMRYMLYEADTNAIAFEKEKEAIQAYTDLELLRMDKSTHIHFEIEADRNYMIPPLLWLPVLENIFKHGTRLIAENYLLEFRFIIKNNVLEISSRNYFKANAYMQSGGGIGLENLRKRLAILFPGKHAISPHADDNIYSTSIKVLLA